jgi:hypothetical protein
MAYAVSRQDRITTAGGLDILAGIWLVLSPFALRFYANATGAATTSNVVFGILIASLATARVVSSNPWSVWLSRVNALLGFWILISPWCLGFSGHHSATTNNVIMGLVVLLLASWSAFATTDTTDEPVTP